MLSEKFPLHLFFVTTVQRGVFRSCIVLPQQASSAKEKQPVTSHAELNHVVPLTKPLLTAALVQWRITPVGKQRNREEATSNAMEKPHDRAVPKQYIRDIFCSSVDILHTI